MAMGLDVSGLDALQATLDRALARSQDLSPVWKDFGEEVIFQTHLRAAGGIAPDGSPWPVSARASGVKGQTLDKTGRLLASASYEFSGREFTVFSNDVRAAVHQEGKTIRPAGGHKALAIPLNDDVANQYKAGVSIREQFPGAFVLRSEMGNVFIVRRTAPTSEQLDRSAKSGRAPRGKFGEIEFLFMLVSAVTMPERRWLDFSAEDILSFELIVVRHYGMFGTGGVA